MTREELQKVSCCLKAGLLEGYYEEAIVPGEPESGAEGTGEGKGKPAMKVNLNWIIWRGYCMMNDEPMQCTIRELLFQPDHGADSRGAVIKCAAPGCNHRAYILDICKGDPRNDNSGGRFFQHCQRCPEFGRCIGGDDEHCNKCGAHTGVYPCPCWKEEAVYKDAIKGDKGAVAQVCFMRVAEPCAFPYLMQELPCLLGPKGAEQQDATAGKADKADEKAN